MKVTYIFIQRMKHTLGWKWIPALLVGLLMALPAPHGAMAQVTFVVNSNGDNSNLNPGDGNCNTGEEVGTVTIGGIPVPIMECTLRAAIEEANESSENVIISFDSDWLDVHTSGYTQILLQSALPYITNRVTIAGETHPEFEEDEDHPLGGRPTLVLRGINVTGSGLRFRSESSGSTVRHLSLGGFENSAILLQGDLGSGTGYNYTIENNLIGAVAGTATLTFVENGSHGIDVSSASEPGSGITNISSNIIFNNGGDGIHLRNGTSATFIQANIIGLQPSIGSRDDGFSPVRGNLGAGVYVAETAGPDNQIGATRGNTISNNGSGGIHVLADGQTIFGNHIGLPHDGIVHDDYGLSDYGNDSNGIILESSGSTVGGSGAATNIIGNSQHVGIRVGSGGNEIEANDNEIVRNYIGTDPEGEDIGQSQGIRIDRGDENRISNAVIANNTTGIELRSEAGLFNEIVRNRIIDNGRGIWFRETSGLVGSEEGLGDANVIGNNTSGIETTGNHREVFILGNYIGTDADGNNLGNQSGIIVGKEADNAQAGVAVRIGIPENGNVIGNNATGISFQDDASPASVVNNYIGIHPNGEIIGNAYAIRTDDDARVGPTLIGYSLVPINPDRWDPGSDTGNIIAHNLVGIDFSRAHSQSAVNMFRGNSFFNNVGKAIDLGMDHVDVGGGSTGPNTLLNFPEFDQDNTFYNEETGQIELRYRVRTNATNADYGLIIDLYLADASENQGKTFLGTLSYEEESATNWVFGAIDLPSGLEISAGDHIVATATDESGNTSQFSEAVNILEEEAEILISQEQLDFGQIQESEYATLSLMISNTGNTDLSGDVRLSDDSDDVYQITSGDGDFSLAPDKSLEVTVTFAPESEGSFTGGLEISHDAGNEDSPVQVSFKGDATAIPVPAISVSESEADFGEVAEGETESFSFTIANEGNAELAGEVSLADDAGGVFAITGGGGTFSMDPSEELEVTLSFTPDDAGAFTGQLEISHNTDNPGNPISIDLSGTGIEPTDADLLSDVPAEFSLRQNYPNPFNPVTQIRFDLPESVHVRLDVYNSLGQRVATLINETKGAGSYEVNFDAGNLSSGNYLYRLEAGSEVFTRTMTLVK